MLSKRILIPFFIITICLITFLTERNFCHGALILEGQFLEHGKKMGAERIVKMTLRIYNDEFGGQLLFEEKQEIVAGSEKALFTFEKGNITVRKRTSVLNAETLWVEVESNGQIMSPRLSLAEIDKINNLTSISMSLAEVSLRTAGEPSMLIDSSGVTFTDSVSSAGVVKAYNTDSLYGYGIHGEATGIFGRGVHGVASNSGDYTNFGGYFTALGNQGWGVYGYSAGSDGRGVCGEAAGSASNSKNYGGYFTAAGTLGTGVYGEATGNGTGYGGYFVATEIGGTAVYGTGAKAGGYFLCSAGSGNAVYGHATSTTDYVSNCGGYFSAASLKGKGVYGSVTNTGNGTNYGGYFSAAGMSGRGVYGEATNTGNVENYGGYFIADGESGTGVFGSSTGASGIGIIGHSAGAGSWGIRGNSEGDTGQGVHGTAYGENGIGVYGAGGGYDFYAGSSGSSTTDYGTFTGAHDVRFADLMPEKVDSGMIVSVTGRVAVPPPDAGGEPISSTLPSVVLSSQVKDKNIFGVIVKEGPLPFAHWYRGTQKERFGIVNALGEGRVWVSNINGPVMVGDYITSSRIPGYGQRQEDDLLHSYTVGKVTETIDWQKPCKTVIFEGRKIKLHLICVVYTSG